MAELPKHITRPKKIPMQSKTVHGTKVHFFQLSKSKYGGTGHLFVIDKEGKRRFVGISNTGYNPKHKPNLHPVSLGGQYPIYIDDFGRQYIQRAGNKLVIAVNRAVGRKAEQFEDGNWERATRQIVLIDEAGKQHTWFSRNLSGKELTNMIRAKRSGAPVEEIIRDGKIMLIEEEEISLVDSDWDQYRSEKFPVHTNRRGAQAIDRKKEYRAIVEASGKPLLTYFKTVKSLKKRRQMCLQIAQAFGKLNNAKIRYSSRLGSGLEMAHYRPDNLTVDSRGNLRIIDFSQSTDLSRAKFSDTGKRADFSKPRDLQAMFYADAGMAVAVSQFLKVGGPTLRRELTEAYANELKSLNPTERNKLVEALLKTRIKSN